MLLSVSLLATSSALTALHVFAYARSHDRFWLIMSAVWAANVVLDCIPFVSAALKLI